MTNPTYFLTMLFVLYVILIKFVNFVDVTLSAEEYIIIRNIIFVFFPHLKNVISII